MQLSSDDFNYCSSEGKICFSYLGQQTSKFYSPSIESALPYLRSRVWGGAVRTVNANEEFTVESGDTVFVHFRNGVAHQSQNARLAAHDLQIEEIVARLGQKNIVYVYTAIENHETLKRVARQAEPAGDFQSRGDNYVIRILQLSTKVGETRANLTIGTPTFAIGTEQPATTATLTLPTNSSPLVFSMVHDGGQWFVSELKYGDNVYTSGTKIGANNGFSFSCTPEIAYATPTAADSKIYITGLQLQLDLNRAVDTIKMSFGEADDCVGFTSPGIWGGLFVTFLLLAIMTIGISWMLDIRTMDRFDDPKGKTIIINATD